MQSRFLKALKYAEKYNIPKVIGSDAHIASEIPNAIMEIPYFKTKQEFLNVLSKATLHKHRTSIFNFITPTLHKIRKRF